MTNDNFKNRMGKLIEDNLDMFVDDGQDASEELDRIYADFKQSVAADIKKERKKSHRYIRKIGIAAAVVAAIFVCSLALSDTPMVRAIRVNAEDFFMNITNPDATVMEDGTIVEDFSSFEEFEKRFGYLPLEVPWVPDGYVLNTIQVISTNTDDDKVFTYSYYNADKQPIGYIEIGLYFGVSDHSSSSQFITTEHFESVDVNGTEVAVSSETPSSAHFIYHEVYEVNIASDLDPATLIRIIQHFE